MLILLLVCYVVVVVLVRSDIIPDHCLSVYFDILFVILRLSWRPYSVQMAVVMATADDVFSGD